MSKPSYHKHVADFAWPKSAANRTVVLTLATSALRVYTVGMTQAIVLLIPLLLLAFWAWMFSDMLRNPTIPGAEPPGLRWPPSAKNHWIPLFVILNIFAAGYYYFTEYKNRH